MRLRETVGTRLKGLFELLRKLCRPEARLDPEGR